MKKFEQVSSDDHWMSAAGRIKSLIFFRRIRGQGQGRGHRYDVEVDFIKYFCLQYLHFKH